MQLGYPVGYHGFDSDIPRYRNPRMSVTTMELLGLSDGRQRGLVRVIVMHFFMVDRVAHAIECVNLASPFKHAVDQDGALYMKFVHHEHAERMEKSHLFIDNQMVKFLWLRMLLESPSIMTRQRKRSPTRKLLMTS